MASWILVTSAGEKVILRPTRLHRRSGMRGKRRRNVRSDTPNFSAT
jgi:hypothetical protein